MTDRTPHLPTNPRDVRVNQRLLNEGQHRLAPSSCRNPQRSAWRRRGRMSNDDFCMSNRLNFGLRTSAVALFPRQATTGGASSRIRSCHPRAVLFSPKASGIFQPSGKRRRSAALGRASGEQNQRREQPDQMLEHLRDGMTGSPSASQKNRRAIFNPCARARHSARLHSQRAHGSPCDV